MIGEAPEPDAQVATRGTLRGLPDRLRYVAASLETLQLVWKDMLLLESSPADPFARRRIIQELEALARASKAHGYPEIEGVSAGICAQFRKSAAASDNDALRAGRLRNGLEVLAVLVHESQRQLRASETGE